MSQIKHRESVKPRIKKKTKLLNQSRYDSCRNIEQNSKMLNIKDLVVGIDKKFPIMYTTESNMPIENICYKNLIESNSTDSKETTILKKIPKRSLSVSKSSIGSQTNFCQISPKNREKSVSSCYIIQLYFIYLILCIIVMCCGFGFYYLMVSTSLKLDHLEKRLNEKLSKEVSMIMFMSKKYNDKDYQDYDDKILDKPYSNIKSLKLNSMLNKTLFEETTGSVINTTKTIFQTFHDVKNTFLNNSSTISSTYYTKSNIDEFKSTKSNHIDDRSNNTEIIKTSLSFETTTKSNLIQNLKINKIRHKKRLEKEFSNSSSVFNKLKIFSKNKCNLKFVNPTPTSLSFIGIFHCNWMNDIGSLNSNYYITKGFKGISVTMCQNLEELKNQRCYHQLPLKYSYYGTGHTIYKNYMFYNQEGDRNLIVHRLDGTETNSFSAPNDSFCCNQENILYNIKHSGYYDFKTDENGLWLIYRDSINGYVVAKIDESDFKNLKIYQKWRVNVHRDNVSNMFITCGQLYALKNTSNNPAVIYKICDLLNDFECKNTYDDQNFNISISSRQITSFSYNPEKKILHVVDGGSFVYYKFQV